MAVLGGKIYVLGGEEGWDHYHDTIECYDPVVDKWELVGEMGSSRSWLSCVGKQKKKALFQELEFYLRTRLGIYSS